jgi:hypothetical protein
MAQLTQTEAKYLFFDAMLAAQELSWAARLPSLVVEMIDLDLELTEFHNVLDKFKDLVYNGYVSKNGQEEVIFVFKKDILPRLESIEIHLANHKNKFKNYTVAQKQLQNILKLKYHFNIT